MSFFKEFSKIEARKEIILEKSDLEKVLDIENEIIRQYKTDELFKKYGQKHGKGYHLLYASIQNKLKDVNLSSEILQSYIMMKDNSAEETESVIRGMYSGALLEILCRTQPSTSLFINGKNRTWHYLFYQVRYAKNIAIEHFKGNNILSCAGSDGGSVENIIVNHLIGDDTLQGAGHSRGTAKHLFLNNIQGNYTLASAGWYRGTAEHVTLNQIKGDRTLAYATAEDGHITYVTLNKIRGKFTLDNVDRFYSDNKSTFLHDSQMSTSQEEILGEMLLLTKMMHTFSSEEQKSVHIKIAQLQKEIFIKENMWKKASENFFAT